MIVICVIPRKIYFRALYVIESDDCDVGHDINAGVDVIIFLFSLIEMLGNCWIFDVFWFRVIGPILMNIDD